jgi:hypothetical protein
MEKVNESICELIEQVTKQIHMDNNEVPYQDIVKSANKVIRFTRARCKGHLKNGNRCRSMTKYGEEYCLRHVQFPEEDDDPHQDGCDTTHNEQCAATTESGYQCIKNARKNSEFCGIHISANKMKSRRPTYYNCLYYKEKKTNDDEEEDPQGHRVFCSKIAQPNMWFCKKHTHLQDKYQQTYKCKSFAEYKTKKAAKDISPILFLEKIIDSCC